MRFPLLLALGALLVWAAPASALTVSQLPGTAGCLDDLTRYGCADARAATDTQAVAVAPDGRHVYLASGLGSNGSLTGFARDPSTGALTSVAGEGGAPAARRAPRRRAPARPPRRRS